ncbi:HlyD family secretion protein [Meridianimarinicoccus sp. RP-17]|uniref:HlyD family secretion protein n=1 Tax=Meridianimarinicoccus zhengii TaxID=2056810 RepID=UPI000DAE9E8C|nr:biotin/lipoyl-binding protein [Phycocomes zhengii]
MFELLFCSLFTLLPDFLYRRFGQGKRIGQEITLFSVWYELRWGITGCLILALGLITVVFFFHPSTSAVSSYFRTVTILPETPGRVVEVNVRGQQRVEAGDVLFRLDDSSQQAALETARRRIAEVDASLSVAQDQLAATAGQLDQAIGLLDEAENELARQLNLLARNPNVVSDSEIDRLQSVVTARQGAVDSARANQAALQTQIDLLIPAQRASAEAALAQAQAELDKTIVRAGVTGTVEQFQLQVGDYISAILRPAGILVPAEYDRGVFVAGFNQLAGGVVKPGMLAEISCASLPFRIVPMVVTGVQDVIATGQFRPSDQLIDPLERTGRPGSLTVRLEPLFEGQADAIPPGSACVANAYTSFHDQLDDPDLGFWTRLGLHGVETVGIVHAILLRSQTLLLPVRSLVLTGSH